MQDALKKFEQILRKNGDSVTAARRQVFTALYGHEPQSMLELQKRLDGKVDRVSIYRAIELFSRLGIANKIQIGWKYKVELSDVFIAHHHHISCLGCGKVFAIHEDERIEQLIAEIAAANNITQPAHQLEIQGYCSRCARGAKSRSD